MKDRDRIFSGFFTRQMLISLSVIYGNISHIGGNISKAVMKDVPSDPIGGSENTLSLLGIAFLEMFPPIWSTPGAYNVASAPRTDQTK
jgi:hypothetical protein